MTAKQKVAVGVAAAWAVVAAPLLLLGDSPERIYMVLFSGVAVAAAVMSVFRTP